MSILDSFNTLSKILLGVGIVDVYKQAPQTKEAQQKAEKLAQTKHLREAVNIAEKALAVWYKKPGFWERLIRQLLLGNLLGNFTQQLHQWRRQVLEADKLAVKAKNLLKQDNGDPLETQAIVNAIALYQSCTQILHDERISRAINKCQRELQRRQQFQILVKKAQSHAENRFFQNAIAVYREAEELYSTEALQQAINAAKSQVETEKIYYAAFQRAQQAQNQGKLQRAIAILEAAVANFPRSDGLELLQEIQLTIKGREQFRQGLAAEKAGNFPASVSLYENAKLLLPNPTDCQIRLGIVAIKTENWAIALSHLMSLPGEQAAYLRGFAYAKQENLQQAHREWQGLSTTALITEQRQILNSLAQRKRLLLIQNIEQFVNTENLDRAQNASQEFIQKFGLDPLVEANLKEHIQPCIAVELWQSGDWKIITNELERIWISQPNITTLHNWTVATYYCFQSDFSNLSYLIISLSTALANLTKDPTLKDVPWLGNQPIDFTSISLELKRRLEAAIDTYKDTDIQKYLNFRDQYRLELVALKLMGEPSQQGMKVNDVFITPGCYHHYISLWRHIVVHSIDSSQQILRSLYTSWGLAVAACLEGDAQRAIQLKPATQTTNTIEIFAQKFVAYHEGCYHLNHKKWRNAITSLKEAKSEIQANKDWQQEIDRLCGLQRQAISEIPEHLEFAQFWYDILASQPARSYLAEYKAENIREQVADEKITLDKALKELQEIKKIDAQNPIVLDLIQRIEFQQEIEAIEKLLKSNKFEEAVKLAKKSHNQRIRNVVADICLDILAKGFQNRDLGFEDIYNLGKWAYELSPDAENVQEIYKFSQELKEIHDLMKCDRFDEAIRRAKYSQHESIRHYVAQFFIMTLVKGLEDRDLSFELVQQLGRWAYEICPDEPAFQTIYHSLNIH
ncbi:MAG: peptidase M, neutral zinc metallopeptidase site [Aulosira sp. ZfuVER01]|nr:peptidase M, neutral zinc metallopeptidase site [Aulosira sp. ZfuVER01]MDZ8001481.1 peptidase M, neutral zinc metallopeptidase site [Aulosira sp. DedVER01a]MDZ8051651.1 peptidase M, neutral zinc metallopeptidase site [Aulosira sp. ZfuCHP01]